MSLCRKGAHTGSLMRWVVLGSALAGCGGAPAKEPQKPASAPPPAVVAAPRAPDLSKVPPPSHLVALARWKNPAASLAQVSAWTGLPLKPATLLREMGEEMGQLVEV